MTEPRGTRLRSPRPNTLFAALFFFLAPHAGCFADQSPDLVYANVSRIELKLDLHRPDGNVGKPWPVLVWIHGGAWIEGSRKNSPLTPLTDAGYAVVSVSYRFAGEAPFPAQIQDVKRAVRWLRAHAAEYSLDRARIGVAGESAGGHLAALLGLTANAAEWEVGDHRDFSSGVKAVVALCAPTDLRRMDPAEPSVESLLASGDEAQGQRARLILSREGILSRLLGAPASTVPHQVRAASPINHVSSSAPPFLLIHGDRDQLVPPYQSRALREALAALGVAAELRMVNGAGHGFSRLTPELLSEIKRFFDRHLKAPETTAKPVGGTSS